MTGEQSSEGGEIDAGAQVSWVANGETGIAVRSDGDRTQVRLTDGRLIWIPSDELEVVSEVGGPIDPTEMLADGQIGEGLAYALRLQALYLKHAYRYDPLSGLSNARIEPKLHQVYAAHTVTATKLRPRMILADEVGLGKTIEAGLILKELKARGLISRVLVVVPASLLYQWQQELRSKFNESFEIVDGAALKFLGRDGTNPWTKYDNILCSLPFAQRHTEKIAEADWDFVIFDEAHRVRRTGDRPRTARATLAYRLGDEIKEHVTGILLLTATPMQLHPFELYSLVELVEPGLFRNWEHYDRVRRQVPDLNELMRHLKAWRTLKPEAKLDALERGKAFLSRLPTKQTRDSLDEDELRERAMDELVGQHPHSNVMVRNRKAEIGGFMKREARRGLVEPSPEERAVYDDVTEYLRESYNLARLAKNVPLGFLMVLYQKMLTSSTVALRASFERRIGRLREAAKERAAAKKIAQSRLDELQDAFEASAALEEMESAAATDDELVQLEIDRLEDLIDRLGEVRDAKADKLVEIARTILSDDPDEKIIIFTQFIETQRFLAEELKAAGFSVAIFNGRLNAEEKEEAVRQFRKVTQVLISTEAGGEGRNFQFCHFMVNYDLPWNPMKVEQRIGRLDRIGQTRTVFIYNLALTDTIEQRVLDVLEHRIELFKESVGSLDPILGEVERAIEEIVLADIKDRDKHFQRYEVDLEKQVSEARELERTMADFVLDHASFRRDEANELLGRSPLGKHPDLRAHVAASLDYWGGGVDEHIEGGDVLSFPTRLGPRLGTRQSAIRGSFDPHLALAMEEIDFFAFGHPIIDAILRLPIDEEPQVTAARRVSSVTGGPYLEVYYQLEAMGLRPSGRFIRHLVGVDLTVTSADVTSPPELGREVKLAVPSWVAAAVRASWLLFEKEHASERENLRFVDEGVKEEEVARADRVFEYQNVRLAALIDESREWIEQVERSGTPGQQRVLPARKGKLRKDEERLADLKARHEASLERIRTRRPGVSSTVVAAGLVVGVND